MTPISSSNNTRIKQIRALRSRKAREQSGTFFIEGIQAVVEAVQLHAAIETLIVAPELLASDQARALVAAQRRAGTALLEVTAAAFETMAAKDVAHGLAAVVRQRWTPLAALQPCATDCWVALDAVQYPGNLGTILRTSDAAGGAGVLLLGNTADPYDPECVRASVGAIFSQRLVRTNVAAFAAWVRQHDLAVIGTSPAAVTDYREVEYRRPLVLLMGGERNGLSEHEQALCDAVVRIPMVGRRDSLNLAVATSLMLYEALRQRLEQV
ncbi:MAG TPA: RNA methyltransferase [Roseiflexaceae bacterium]|jgi:TrmH family RNA methyltransferase|nr:RNA methyltransferase [Roseiflexaceae bacterium]